MESDDAKLDVDVLLVEDDPVLAAMYRIKLVAEGYQVRLAADGPGGLAAALARPPDDTQRGGGVAWAHHRGPDGLYELIGPDGEHPGGEAAASLPPTSC